MNPTDEKNPTQGLRLYNPNPIRMGELHVSCIELTDTETRIDFIYFAPKKYTKGGWIQIHSETFIRINAAHDKFKLLEAINIPIAPDKHYFNHAGESKNFTLVFPQIPDNTRCMDVIEREAPGTYFNFYQLDFSTWKTTPFSIGSHEAIQPCTLTTEDLNELRIKILTCKLALAQLAVRKQDCIRNQRYEQASDIRSEEKDLNQELKQLKTPLLDWFIQTDRLPSTWPLLSELYRLLTEFPERDDHFLSTFKEELLHTKKRLIDRLVNCHIDRDIEQIRAHHHSIRSIDEFLNTK